jgi:hypothetical protein
MRCCADNDVPRQIIESLMTESDLNIITARDCGMHNQDDEAIRQWAKRENRVLLTCNYTEFYNDEQKHPIHMCPGIIALGGRNEVERAPALIEMLAALIDQLARRVKIDWWPRTKIKINPKICWVRMYRNGQRTEYDLKADEHGHLWFKERP